jgi:hypothetical protein
MSLNGRSRTVSVDSYDAVIDKYGYLRFDFAVYANEMDGMVQLTVQDAEGNALKIQKNDLSLVDVYERSVGTYIASASATTNNSDLKGFLDAMQSYGEYAKYFFDNRKANESLNGVTPDAPDAYVLEEYTAGVIGVDSGYSGPTFYGGSLGLVSGTDINVWFEGDVEGCTFRNEKGDELTPIRSGNMYYVTIDNIAAKDIDESRIVTVTDAGGYTCTVEYCAFNYVKLVLSSQTTSRSLKDICIKLYDYAMAANQYFDNRD